MPAASGPQRAIRYRFIGRNGFKTRWRPFPKGGAPRPSKSTAQKLGEGYSYQVVYPARES